MKVFVVQTGVANIAAVMAGLRRVGGDPALTTDRAILRRADRVVLPGVGAFGAGMVALAEAGLTDVLRERVARGRPTLAVCLGLQLLASTSEESPGIGGLGLFDLPVTRFSMLPKASLRVPHMGWNRVTGLGASGEAYFANSFKLDRVPPGWSGAFATHGVPFVAALWRGEVLGCQFHPELSGSWGLDLMRAWMDGRLSPTVGRPTPPRAGGLRRRIIPCLDVRNGRVVKGVRFQGLRDAGDPRERAAAYQAQGGDELVVLDVAATQRCRGAQLETVAAVRDELSMPLTVGGGVRTADDAKDLLGAGADKVSINTAAVLRPGLVNEVATRFGRQCTVIAIDAARVDNDTPARWEVVIRGGSERTGRDAVTWAREVVRRGAGELLVTSWDRDGTHAGYDLALVEAISAAVPVPVIASGGAHSAEDMASAMNVGAQAVLAASIFHDGDSTVGELKARLIELGAEVRV